MEFLPGQGIAGIAVLLVTLMVVLVAFLWWNKEKKRKNKQNPCCAVPGLESSDAELGNLGDIGKAGSLHEFLVKLHKDYGTMASFWWGKQQTLSIASLGLYKQTSKLFNRPGFMFLMFEPLVTTDCIMFANGADGQKRHHDYMRCFSHEVLGEYQYIVNENAKELTNKWLNAAADKEQVSLMPHCFNFVIKGIARAGFGELFQSEEEVSSLAKHYTSALTEMEARISGSVPPAGSPRDEALMEDVAVMKNLIRKAMEVRRLTHDTSRQMIIDVIMESGYPEESQFGDAINMFVAGFHTTGPFLTWCFYFLARHQDIQDKVVQELHEVLQEEPISVHNMSELVYLRQVLDESLRVSKLVPYTARITEEETTLGGYTIPPGIPILHALGVTMQDRELWPDPERFDPDRFSPENCQKMSKFCFEPFGFAGGRKCPGYRFALMQITFLMATVLKKMKVKLVDANLRVTTEYGLVNHPKQDILVYFEKR